MSIPTTALPNGKKVYYLREQEVPVLYTQIQQYLRHGIELHPGDTLFDVGANIGLFSLWASEQCQNDLQIYAFEPIPEIFAVLSRNAELLPQNRMKVFECGLAQASKSVIFDYYPNATVLSTAYPDSWQQTRSTIRQAIETSITHPSDDEPVDVTRLRRFPPLIRSLLIYLKLNQLLQVKSIRCQMRSLSEIIRVHPVQQIDLLKLDVEGSELDVLLGIESQDWHKIQQIVVEVHNQSQRIDQITALLKQQGFSKITIEQELMFQDTDIFNLYAAR
jgi:FkbM family methyltransferase